MNLLKAEIKKISRQGSLVLVELDSAGHQLTAVMISTFVNDKLQVSDRVNVEFKETEVIMANSSNIDVSLQNRLTGTIESIESSELLAEVSMNIGNGQIRSIITQKAVKKLDLTVGQKATAMIKTNELMIST